jgi:hypothetical protein
LYTQKVDVYDARTGSPGGTSGYVDVELDISATRRANGESVVLVETTPARRS